MTYFEEMDMEQLKEYCKNAEAKIASLEIDTENNKETISSLRASIENEQKQKENYYKYWDESRTEISELKERLNAIKTILKLLEKGID